MPLTVLMLFTLFVARSNIYINAMYYIGVTVV